MVRPGRKVEGVEMLIDLWVASLLLAIFLYRITMWWMAMVALEEGWIKPW